MALIEKTLKVKNVTRVNDEEGREDSVLLEVVKVENVKRVNDGKEEEISLEVDLSEEEIKNLMNSKLVVKEINSVMRKN